MRTTDSTTVEADDGHVVRHAATPRRPTNPRAQGVALDFGRRVQHRLWFPGCQMTTVCVRTAPASPGAQCICLRAAL
eukprot:gene19352-biopygen2496